MDEEENDYSEQELKEAYLYALNEAIRSMSDILSDVLHEDFLEASSGLDQMVIDLDSLRGLSKECLELMDSPISEEEGEIFYLNSDLDDLEEYDEVEEIYIDEGNEEDDEEDDEDDEDEED